MSDEPSNDAASSAGESSIAPGDHKELANGLIFIHTALGGAMAGAQQLSAHVYALTELLVAKGVVSLHEFEERRRIINEQMMTQMREKWLGARMQAEETDKYDPRHEVQIDCANRLHLCKAACCRLGFYLSKQDLEEGAVRWDLSRPYHIAQNENGYCTHCDASALTCTIRSRRPVP